MTSVVHAGSGVGEAAVAPPPSPTVGGPSAGAAVDTDIILSVNNIEVVYDHVILVLKGVSLIVPRGWIVALLGANGAGKSTTLKAISNLLHAERGEVTKRPFRKGLSDWGPCDSERLLRPNRSCHVDPSHP